jgi:hypothetical protein
MNTLDLPVSFGEALDKLSILEIKLDKIKDERRKDVQVEYDMLLDKLTDKFNDDSKYHYTILKDINLKIWEMQDIFRDSKDEKEKNTLCIQIIDDNDRRFRIKSKLNVLFNSHLREQKGYTKKKAFVLSHLGLGDCLTFSGAVRFLSTHYDEVKVVCKEKYSSNIKLLYHDDPSITFHVVEDDNDISPRFGCDYNRFLTQVNGYDVYMCGLHILDKQPVSFDTLPFSFYKDVGIDYNIFWNYFHMPSYKESLELYLELVNKGVASYAIVHGGSSTGECVTVDKIENSLGLSRETTLFIDVNKNIYKPEDKYYSLAEQFVNKPLVHYKDILINANYIILSDSSVFCMAMNLPIKTTNCYVVSRSNDYSYIYSDQFGFSPKMSKPVFKPLPSSN